MPLCIAPLWYSDPFEQGSMKNAENNNNKKHTFCWSVFHNCQRYPLMLVSLGFSSELKFLHIEQKVIVI